MFTLRCILVVLFCSLISAAFAAGYHDPRGRFMFDVPKGWTLGEDKANSEAKPNPERAVGEREETPVGGEGLQTFESPGGGHILAGAVGKVVSGAEAFRAGLRRTRGHFDDSLNLLRVVRSKDEKTSLATFSATRNGALVGGLAISMYDPDASSHFALLFDAPEHLSKSLPTMLKRLDEITREQIKQETLDSAPASGGNGNADFARFEKASRQVTLTRTEFPDGTASIGVAPGFTPQAMTVGAFSASSPSGAYINLFVPCPILDPNSDLYRRETQIGRFGGGPPQIPGQVVLPYDSDPAKAWQTYLSTRARQQRNPDPKPQVLSSSPLQGVSGGWNGKLVTGTITWRGEPFVFTGILLTSPPPDRQNGSWMLQVTILAAPTSHAEADMPALIAMQQSEKVDLEKVRDVTMRNIRQIQEQTARWLAANKAAYDESSRKRFDSAMATARANREAMDKSTAAFIDHIRDQAVIQHDPSGAHGRLDANLASALEQADPQHFHVISAKEYVKGRDF